MKVGRGQSKVSRLETKAGSQPSKGGDPRPKGVSQQAKGGDQRPKGVSQQAKGSDQRPKGSDQRAKARFPRAKARSPVFALTAVLLASALPACTHAPRASVVAPRNHAPAPRVDDAFSPVPDLLFAIRPAKLTHDPLYGPLLRRAIQLASTHAGLGASVGTTALAVLERADDVIIGVYDDDARDAVVAVRGVPADVDAARVVDTEGHALWAHVADLSGEVEELASATPDAGAPSSSASLFVLPHRAWVIAVGPAVVRVRTAFAEGIHSRGAALGSLDPDALAVARLRGELVIRARPRLLEGPLAPLVTHLDVVTATVQPGPEGSIGEVVARFLYADGASSIAAESCANDVLGAFVRTYDKTAPWLHAVKITREERGLVVRGRIPRAWAEGFAHPDPDVGITPEPPPDSSPIPGNSAMKPLDTPRLVQ